MKILTSYFAKVFRSQVFSYQLPVPEEKLLSALREELETTAYTLQTLSVQGRVHGNSFFMELMPIGHEQPITFNSTLQGNVLAIDPGRSRIILHINRSFGVYVLSVVSIIAGLILLVSYLRAPVKTAFLGWGLMMLLGGPCFCIWRSNISGDTLKERFEMILNRRFPK